MATRKSTPDILNDLLGGAETPKRKEARKPASNKAIKQDSKTAIKQESNTYSNTAQEISPEEGKHKATYSLSSESLAALEEAWIKLRKMSKSRAQISRSLIVEQAILLAVEDLADKEDKSALARKLL